jgi:GH24 family phage-related lysozyme (muramidase)
VNYCDYAKLLDQVIRIEGARLGPYRDATGNLIVAPQHYLEALGVSGGPMTVLEADVRAVARELEERWPVVGRVDDVRYRVLVHIAFNIGVRGVLATNRFVGAVELGSWARAAKEMLISQWADQEPHRATVLAAMVRTGRDDALTVSEARSAVSNGSTSAATSV